MKILSSSSFMLAIISILLLSCASGNKVKSNEFGNNLHSPAQIIKIMGQSKLVYKLDALKEKITRKTDEPKVLHNQFVLVQNETGFGLKTYELSEKEKEIFNEAEANFESKDYNQSLLLFKKLNEIQPDYAYSLTMIGDVFYNLSQFDSAEVYFLKAISLNPVDYTAHWFLADTYWQKGNGKEAIKSITKAHLLNKNNPRLLKSLKNYRNQIGDPWEEWTFEPQYRLSKQGNKITVEFDSDWLGYALVKALWKYEPGYSNSMIGKEPDEYVFNSTEEAEAISSLLSGNKKMMQIEKIVKDGYFNEFFYYEIVAQDNPTALLLFPQNNFDRLVEYVDRFH